MLAGDTPITIEDFWRPVEVGLEVMVGGVPQSGVGVLVVLEVQAGTGVMSVVAAAVGASVTLSEGAGVSQLASRAGEVVGGSAMGVAAVLKVVGTAHLHPQSRQ